MAAEPLTIAQKCEKWALWAAAHGSSVKGLPSVSVLAARENFQSEEAIDHVGVRVTARGKQTRVTRIPDLPDNPEMEQLDRAIASLSETSPGLHIVLLAEHMGCYPELREEAFSPVYAGKPYWARLQLAWGLSKEKEERKVFTMARLYRRNDETVDMWRERLGKKLGMSRTTFYALLRESYSQLTGYIGGETAMRRQR